MDLVVTTALGQLRGTLDDGVPAFFGIPYAESPSGTRRFRPPVPIAPWGDLREASQAGPIAPQPPPSPLLAIPGDPIDQSEDCLSLNIWIPSLNGEARPVMVFIHGGSFITGTGSSSVYRGRWLAAQGDVVVVTVNYRLGALGFLAHPALVDDDGAVGNYGLMDQVEALRWVSAHIGAFGGDPENVTVFGESAGAMSVCSLLAAPSAQGLFHRAIVQSGPPFVHSTERAFEVSDHLCRSLGLEGATREDLEAIPAERLVKAVEELSSLPPAPGNIALPLLPVIDGVFLPRDPGEAIAAGSAAGISLMIGSNRDEMTIFSLGDPSLAAIDEGGLASWLELAMPGCDPAEVVMAYVAARTARGEPTDPSALWVALASDVIFRWPSVVVAAQQSAHSDETYAYLFTYETPLFDGILGSCHALELPFVFGTLRHEAIGLFALGGESNAAAEALSDEMIRTWSTFARTGLPESPEHWTSFSPSTQATRIFGPGGGQHDRVRADELEAVGAVHLRQF